MRATKVFSFIHLGDQCVNALFLVKNFTVPRTSNFNRARLGIIVPGNLISHWCHTSLKVIDTPKKSLTERSACIIAPLNRLQNTVAHKLHNSPSPISQIAAAGLKESEKKNEKENKKIERDREREIVFFMYFCHIISILYSLLFISTNWKIATLE